MFESAATIFFLLLCGHALGDFALQTDWVAANKERPKPGAHQSPTVWPYLLIAHSLHHGLFVFLVTQKLSLGIAETVVHALSDLGKGERIYGFHVDQALHIGSKVIWTLFVVKNWA